MSVNWLPDDFFIGHPGPPEARPARPIGQGDVFVDVPVCVSTVRNGDQVGAKVKHAAVIVVGSSCGMRKTAGGLNDAIHVAPIHRLARLAPGWSTPWGGHLQVLPLPGLRLPEHDDQLAADLGRIGLCGMHTLDPRKRVASVSAAGMRALKARLSGYFIRVAIPAELVLVGASEEWYELDLWEQWVTQRGTEDGFQPWLDGENPDYPYQRRRDTLYDDYVGLGRQIADSM